MERTAPATERVRTEMRCATRPTGAGDRHAQIRVGHVGEERRIGVAVFAWWQRRRSAAKRPVRQLQIAIALVLLGVGADADRPPLLVEVANDGRLKLRNTWLALVQDEKRQDARH